MRKYKTLWLHARDIFTWINYMFTFLLYIGSRYQRICRLLFKIEECSGQCSCQQTLLCLLFSWGVKHNVESHSGGVLPFLVIDPWSN